MNMYLVTLGNPQGCINVRSYVVVSESEALATMGDAMRRNIYEYLTEHSRYFDYPATQDQIMDGMFQYEMPMTREEMDRDKHSTRFPLRVIESVKLIATDVDTALVGYTDEGHIVCCDYYSG
jgi:hypothetical protein